MNAPVFTQSYNLNRLGQAGDKVSIRAGDDDRVGLAGFANVLRVDMFEGRVVLRKLSPDRFALDYTLQVDLVQACVVTLAQVPARIERQFTRELHFNPGLHRAQGVAGADDNPLEDDLPEEIDSLHYDVAAPLIEEFLLAVDPYPRAGGVEFHPPGDGANGPESPFAVLKGLKSGL